MWALMQINTAPSVWRKSLRLCGCPVFRKNAPVQKNGHLRRAVHYRGPRRSSVLWWGKGKKQPVDVLLQAAAHRPVCFSSDVLTLAELRRTTGGFVAVLEHYQPLNPQKNQNSLSDSGLQSGRRPKSVWRTVVRRGETPPFPSPKAHFSLSRRSLYVD